MCVCRYSPHIKRLIDLGREDVEWVDAAQDPELLSYSGVRKFGYNCNGTTDLLAAKRSAVKAHHPEKGAQILFDVSLKLAESDLRHAQVRVLLANLHAPAEKPVVVSSIPCLGAMKLFCYEHLHRLARQRFSKVLVLARIYIAPPPMAPQLI